MKKIVLLTAAIAALLCAGVATAQPKMAKDDTPKPPQNKVFIAYVFSRFESIPDPSCLTHINYAFGHVNDTFNGVRIDNPDKLKKIAKLKKKYPHLKVLLSIGGWGSGRFSEMSADPELRLAFAEDCRKVVRKYKLDGIDIDWEYPGVGTAGISFSEKDTENYTLLMRDIRAAIGPDKILSQATVASARFIDFKAVDQYVNYTNAMTYDLGNPPYFNSALYRNERVNPESMSVDEGIRAHLEAGVPPEKLVMGLAFYGHGTKSFPRRNDPTKVYMLDGYTYNWDDVAKNPYMTDSQTGEFVYGYENEKSLRIKAQYINEMGLLGAMYWQYDADSPHGDLRRAVAEALE